MVAVKTTSVSDFVNAVATVAASRLRNWKCTSTKHKKQVHKFIMGKVKSVASPGWGWMTWMTNKWRPQNAPSRVATGRRRFKVQFVETLGGT